MDLWRPGETGVLIVFVVVVILVVIDAITCFRCRSFMLLGSELGVGKGKGRKLGGGEEVHIKDAP